MPTEQHTREHASDVVVREHHVAGAACNAGDRATATSDRHPCGAVPNEL
jgi:hypothetical protein